MKGIINKTKYLFILLIALISFSGINAMAATNVPSTLKTGSSKTLPGYVAGVYFGVKKTTDGKYLYCTDITKRTPANMTLYLSSQEQDAGLTYLMVNGFPNKKITGNNDYDYYITQTAQWWYLDSTRGTSNLSSSFKNNGSDPHGLRPYIKKLVNGAIKAKKTGYVNPSLTITASDTTLTLASDGYYYSKDIKVTAKAISGNIKLKLVGAPSETTIVNSNGTSVSSVKSGTVVKIKVKKDKVTNTNYSITINATATGVINKTYLYQPKDKNTYQSVTTAVTYQTQKPLSSVKTFSLKSSQVKIYKLDSETKKAIAGAKLELRDSKGNVVAKWTSTTSAYVIKNIAAGTYKLVETAAPSGYTLDTTEHQVVIKSGEVKVVNFYNSKKNPTKIIVIKRDKETTKTLAGAKFVIKDSNNKEVASWTSTEKGHYVTGLPEGEYTVYEVEAPEGYLLATEGQKVKLEAGKTTTVTFYDAKKANNTIIKVLKVDGETGNAVAGAELVVKDQDGNIVKSWTTTLDEYTIDDLPVGKYYLSETKAPNGYALSNEVVSFEIGEDNKITTINYNNVKKVVVPNTGSNSSLIALAVGVVSLGLGGTILYINARKEA